MLVTVSGTQNELSGTPGPREGSVNIHARKKWIRKSIRIAPLHTTTRMIQDWNALVYTIAWYKVNYY